MRWVQNLFEKIGPKARWQNMKSWRESTTGKIWATTRILMYDTTEEEIGTMICCGSCGTTSPRGYLLRAEESSGEYDWNTFDPKFMLLALEYFRHKSSSAHLHSSYRWEDGDNWYLGSCCRKAFSRNCADLGFKILHKRKRRRWELKTNYGNMQKINDDQYWKKLFQSLLDSGLIRYSRTKDGRLSFVSTPSGRKLIQQQARKQTSTKNS